MQQIFHNAAQHPDTQATIRDQTIETILECPVHSIMTWAQHSAMHIQDHATAAAARAKLNTIDIRSFFQIQTIPPPAPPAPAVQPAPRPIQNDIQTYFNAKPSLPLAPAADKNLLHPP